jgi:TorA maturation chaperone TorD
MGYGEWKDSCKGRLGVPAAYNAILADRQGFCQARLRRWAPQVCEQLKNATRHPYYLALAYLTTGVLSLNGSHDHIAQMEEHQ